MWSDLISGRDKRCMKSFRYRYEEGCKLSEFDLVSLELFGLRYLDLSEERKGVVRRVLVRRERPLLGRLDLEK